MRTLVIPDMHVPFHHHEALDFLELIRDEYEPDEIVCIGDLIDIHSVSRHDKDPDGMSAGVELSVTQVSLARFFSLFPEGKLCLGNHDMRYLRAAYRAGIPRAVLRNVLECMDAPDGWEAMEKTIVDGVMFEHGDRFAGKFAHMTAAMNNMRSTVIGHHHTLFGADFFANGEKLIFGASCGCLVDMHSYAMAYGKAYPRKSILGTMIIDEGRTPIMIPLNLNNSGDWTGDL